MSALVMDRRSRGALVHRLGPAVGVWLIAIAWAMPAPGAPVAARRGHRSTVSDHRLT